MTLEEMMERMSADEFAHWVAYDKLDPIGAERLDFLAARLEATLINQWLKKGAEPVRPIDLMADYGELRAKEKAAAKQRAKMIRRKKVKRTIGDSNRPRTGS